MTVQPVPLDIEALLNETRDFADDETHQPFTPYAPGSVSGPLCQSCPDESWPCSTVMIARLAAALRAEHDRAKTAEAELAAAAQVIAWWRTLGKEPDTDLRPDTAESLTARIDSIWRERAETAEAQVSRVRALHERVDGVYPFCDYDDANWPCATVRALDEETDHG